jgi:hypothetical protein
MLLFNNTILYLLNIKKIFEIIKCWKAILRLFYSFNQNRQSPKHCTLFCNTYNYYKKYIGPEIDTCLILQPQTTGNYHIANIAISEKEIRKKICAYQIYATMVILIYMIIIAVISIYILSKIL